MHSSIQSEYIYMDHAQMLITQILKDFILQILDIMFDVWLEIIKKWHWVKGPFIIMITITITIVASGPNAQ